MSPQDASVSVSILIFFQVVLFLLIDIVLSTLNREAQSISYLSLSLIEIKSKSTRDFKIFDLLKRRGGREREEKEERECVQCPLEK